MTIGILKRAVGFALSHGRAATAIAISTSLIAGTAFISAETKPTATAEAAEESQPQQNSEGIVRMKSKQKDGFVRMRHTQDVTQIKSKQEQAAPAAKPSQLADGSLQQAQPKQEKRTESKSQDKPGIVRAIGIARSKKKPASTEGIVRLGEWRKMDASRQSQPKPKTGDVQQAIATSKRPKSPAKSVRQVKAEIPKPAPIAKPKPSKPASAPTKAAIAKSKDAKPDSEPPFVDPPSKKRVPVVKQAAPGNKAKSPGKIAKQAKPPIRSFQITRKEPKIIRHKPVVKSETKKPVLNPEPVVKKIPQPVVKKNAQPVVKKNPQPVVKKTAPPLPDLVGVFTEVPESQADKNLKPTEEISLKKPAPFAARPKSKAKPQQVAKTKPSVKKSSVSQPKRRHPLKELKLGNVFPEVSEESADKRRAPTKTLSLDQYSERKERKIAAKKPAPRPCHEIRPLPEKERPGRFDVGQPFTDVPEKDVAKSVDVEPEMYFSKFKTPVRTVDGKRVQAPRQIESSVNNWNNTPPSRRTKLPPVRKPRPTIARSSKGAQHIPTQTARKSDPIRPAGRFPYQDNAAPGASEETKKKVPAELKPIRDITVNIAMDTSKGTPDNVATAIFQKAKPNKNRDYNPAKWESSELGPPDYDFYNQPLYFEDANLERCGYSLGRIQPAVSALYFFGTAPLMPYKMVVESPDETVYSLGFCPPGRRYCFTRNYLPPWQWDAALVQASVMTGAVYVIP